MGRCSVCNKFVLFGSICSACDSKIKAERYWETNGRKCQQCGKMVDPSTLKIVGCFEYCSSCYPAKAAQEAKRVAQEEKRQNIKQEWEKRIEAHRGGTEITLPEDPVDFLKDIDTKTFVVFDLETTGLHANEGQSVIEIGAVKYSGGQVVSEFSELVKPLYDQVPLAASAVNGITSEMVADKPYIQEVMPRFLKFLDGAPIVSHNLEFDGIFFMYELANCEIDLGNIQGFDTLKTAREIWKYGVDVRNHKLGTLCEFIGYDLSNAHRSLDDAKGAAAVLFAEARAMKARIQKANLAPIMMEYLKEHTPCLQKNLPAAFPDYDPTVIRSTINQLEKAGRIEKGKQGSAVSIERVIQ